MRSDNRLPSVDCRIENPSEIEMVIDPNRKLPKFQILHLIELLFCSNRVRVIMSYHVGHFCDDSELENE